MKKLRESILEDRYGMIVLIFLDSLLQIQSKAIIAFSTFLEPQQYFYILPGSLLSWKISSSNSSPTSTFQLGRARLSLVLALNFLLSCNWHWCALCLDFIAWSCGSSIACNSNLHLWWQNKNVHLRSERCPSKPAVAPQFTNGEDFLGAFLGKKRGSRSRETGTLSWFLPACFQIILIPELKYIAYYCRLCIIQGKIDLCGRDDGDHVQQHSTVA